MHMVACGVKNAILFKERPVLDNKFSTVSANTYVSNRDLSACLSRLDASSCQQQILKRLQYTTNITSTHCSFHITPKLQVKV